MTKNLWLLITASLASLLLVACGGAGASDNGDSDRSALPSAVADSASSRITLDGLAFEVRETPG